MKKLLCIFMVLAIMVSFSACSKGNSSSTESESVKQPAYSFIRIGTASLGGNFYNWGGAIAQMINDKMDIRASSQATNGSAGNCFLVRDGEVEIALSQGNTLYEAVCGSGSFKGEKFETLRSLGTISFNVYHVLVRTDAQINSIADLRGKKIGMGPVGGGIEISGRKFLSEYGIGEKDFTPIYGTSAEMHEQLKTGQMDAYVYAVAVGTAQITDTLANKKIRLLTIPKEDVDKYIANNPDVGGFNIPANTYVNQPEAIDTMGSAVIIFADASMDEDFAYNFTKTFYENNDYLMGYNSGFVNALPENALTGLCLPLHPGSEKYLKEIGIVK